MADAKHCSHWCPPLSPPPAQMHAPLLVAGTLRERLLSWYGHRARDLPWRRTRDAYAVWVSEVMLQQTRVDTVVPYYERFLERFPTAAALAGADEDEVLSLWSGLGYYRRARLLHRGVREVVEHYGGEVPEGPEERLALPGIGRYTAGAIGSIAFDLPEPIVDGNVSRVLARLRGIDTPLGKAVTDKRLWAEAAALVAGDRPGDLNQALMELGSQVCTQAAPACAGCPAANDCVARRTERVSELPVPRVRKAPVAVDLVAVAATVSRPRRTWLVRNEGSLFGGLWGLPTMEGDSRPHALDALRAHGIAARLGSEPVVETEHVLTHRRLRVRLYCATGSRARATATRKPWTEDRLRTVGLSALTRKLLAYAASS